MTGAALTYHIGKGPLAIPHVVSGAVEVTGLKHALAFVAKHFDGRRFVYWEYRDGNGTHVMSGAAVPK